jgi:ubiquinone/menaquinone biosynthesis C-methylase UbiE
VPAKNFIPQQYDPVTYWRTREQPNTVADPGVSKMDDDFFGRFFNLGDKVLELGPGVGRIFKLYQGSASVTTSDIADQHRALLDKKAADLGLHLKQDFLDDPKAKLPYADNVFDVGVSSYVFIHIPFDNIRHTMSELARTCRKVVCFVGKDAGWPNAEQQRKASTHCFAHDYKKIIGDLGLTVYAWDEGSNPDGRWGWIKFAYGR